MKNIFIIALSLIVFSTMSFTRVESRQENQTVLSKVYSYDSQMYSTLAEAQSDKTTEESFLTHHGFSIISSSIETISFPDPFTIYVVHIKYTDAPQ